ncbi:hypothetical protein niasHT_005165 [Heterodera trifolii]|uniref:Uncharacterized protein n=1 Tax=Heterodera trifolii TaxID=157864 RepID=A0ABD2LRQ1_9BILA
MGENLLESYNPLYDVHLRQYFALPHMQKHLRNLGLLDGSPVQQSNELQAGHLAMMDLMLRNRERVLQQLMDLQRKLDAAEKVELYRRIRSGITNADEAERHQQQQQHMSRSLSRPARSAIARLGERRGRRQSLSPEASELIKRVESDYRSDSAPFKNPKSIYNRLAASVYKYQYLHKLDDRTLRKYMLSLRKQLAKLERFREVSFGPHTMAKHPPQQLQQSWFFRRRSLPSLNSANANQSRTHTQQTNAGGQRSLKSGLSHKTRGGKSQSPLKFANAIDEPPLKVQRRTSNSRTRQRLPPLPKKRSFAASRTNTLPTSKTTERLPQATVTKPIRKTPPDPRRVPPPSTAQKKTPTDSRPGSKGSSTPVPVPKRPSASSGGILPAIGAAAAAAGAVHLVLDGKGKKTEEEEGEARESAAPSPSISLAASQTTTTNGGQPGGDSEWEEQRKSSAKTETPQGINGGTETRPTPELFLEQEIGKDEEKDNGTSEEKGMESTEEQQTKTPTEEEKRGEDKTEEQRTADFQRENAPSPEERDEAKQSTTEDKAFIGQTMQTHPAEDRAEDTYAESVDDPATFEEITAKTDEREDEANARSVDHNFEEVNAGSDHVGEEASPRSVDHHFEEVNVGSDHVGEEASPGSVDHHFEEVNAKTDEREDEASARSVDHHFEEVNVGSDHVGEEASPGSVDHHFEEVNAKTDEREDEANARSVDHHFEEVNVGSDHVGEEASPGSIDHHFEEVNDGSDHVGEEASPGSVDHHFEEVNDGSDHVGEEASPGSVDHHFEEVNDGSDHVGEEASPGSVDHHFEEVNDGSDHVGEEASPGSVDHHFEEVNDGSDHVGEEASPGSVDHHFEEVNDGSDHVGEEASPGSVDHHFEEVNDGSDHVGEEASPGSVDHHFEEVNDGSDHVGEEASPGSVDHHFEEVNDGSDHVGEEASPGSVDHNFEEVNAGSDHVGEEASPGSVDHRFEEVNDGSDHVGEEASPGSVDHHFEEVNDGSDHVGEEASPGSVDHNFEEVNAGSDHVGEEASPGSIDHHFEEVNAGSDEHGEGASARSVDHAGSDHVGEEASPGSVDHLFGTALSIDQQRFEDPDAGSQKFDHSWEHKSFEEDNDEQPKKLTFPDEYDQSDFLIENKSIGEQEKEIREEIGFNGQAENGEKPSFEEEKCPPEGCRLYRDDLVESEEVFRNEHDLGRKLSKTEDLSKKMEVNGNETAKDDEDSAETNIVKEDENWMEHKEEEKREEEKEDEREEEKEDEKGEEEERGEEKKEEKAEKESEAEEEEGTIDHYGEPRGNSQDEEAATNEASERPTRENGGIGELDQKIANESAHMGREGVARMEDLGRRPSHHSSAENGISPRQSDDGTRPATAEEIRQSFGEKIVANQLISQPHIQITSASEHGGSVEANLDSPKMQKGRGEVGEGERANEAQLEGRQKTEAQTETNNAEGHQQKQGNGTGKEADQAETRNGHSEAREGAFLGESEGSDEDDGSVIIRNQKRDEWTELEANSDGK